MTETQSTVKRRGFLRRVAAGLAGIGAIAGGGAALNAQAPTENAAGWQPARHPEDAWLDQIPGVHRYILDSVSANGIGQAIFYANNFFTGNRTGYALENKDLAVVICARHGSTPFAYNDAMWAKYGAPLASVSEFTDPKTKQPPTANVYRASGYGSDLRNGGVTLDALIERGVHFAVCQLATRRAASTIARQTDQTVDAVYAELTSNLVGNAHMVPAGIVAVARAQEHGYAFAYVG